MKVAVVTAGGAGMFCGSCMQDNTLVRTLRLADTDAVLVPTYTPIRVDEENVSGNRVFLGGINVYLDSAVPGWKRLPNWMTHWLNRPSIIRYLSRFGSTDAAKLGPLTMDMLKGAAGPQQREVEEFVNYLCDDLKPDVVLFSNALLSGVLSTLRPKFNGKILCLLQGDDIFLEGLNARWKKPVMDQLRRNCSLFDGFLTHSRYYRDFMAEYLGIAPERFQRIPLTIDTNDLEAAVTDKDRSAKSRFRIGYFARICPEKGIQNLLKAVQEVLPQHPDVDVAIGGYLSKHDKKWFERLLAQTLKTCPGQIHWLGSPGTRQEKFQIINDFDLLCVPTDYHEPKGLYVLEAGLCSVPSLLPDHGAFPELVETLGFGSLYRAGNHNSLVECLTKSITENRTDNVDFGDRVRLISSMVATAPSLKAAIASF